MASTVIPALAILLQLGGVQAPQETPQGAPPPQGTAPDPKAAPPQGTAPDPKAAARPEREAPAADEMILRALRSNAEVLRAQAQVREAEAKLREVERRVMRDVAIARSERERLAAAVRGVEANLDRVKRMVSVGQVPPEAVSEAEVALIEARVRQEQNEMQLRYLLGEGDLPGRRGGEEPPRAAGEPVVGAERPPIPERYREALEKRVSLNTRLTLKAAMAWLQDQIRPLNLGSVRAEPDEETDPAVRGRRSLLSETFEFSDVPLRSVLEAFADTFGVCFLFRDYGILVTTPERAAILRAPAIPEDTPLRP
jgi:hypothetical protein